MSYGTEWLDILKSAMIFGIPLVALASTVVQFIKRKANIQGDGAYILSLGIGALFGFGYLALFFPIQSVQDGLLKGLASIVFAFLTPELYGYAKSLSAKGMESHIEEAEKKALE